MTHKQDHFSSIAEEYVTGRISYPSKLFEFLADRCKEKDIVWDCATGSGQAARDLSRYFKHVIATDISEVLLSKAKENPKVTFRKASAEKSGITSNSVDLITVAQAIHWFDLGGFWNEVSRVLKVSGILAFWGYLWPEVNQPIDNLLANFRKCIMDYWPARSKYLHESYSNITPPFRKLDSPKIWITVEWSIHDYIAHIDSWSGTRYYREHTNTDIISDFKNDLEIIWANNTMIVQWPLILKIYKKDQYENSECFSSFHNKQS